MKRFFLILSLLIIPFIKVSPVFGQSTTTVSTLSASPAAAPINNSESIFAHFWSWLLSFFIKDYDIPTESASQQENFTDYGNVNDARNENINSAENRSTSNSQQLYFKGRYIEDVINGIMTDKVIAKICDQKIVSLPNSCGTDFKISCLARYFVQDNQSFLYTDQNGNKENLSSVLIETIKSKSADCTLLPQPQFAEYQNIYLNFFRVPPEYSDASKNENATRVVRTPLPDSSQSPIDSGNLNQDIKNQQKQLNQNFTPEGTKWSGLNSLRPESEK